jgi:ubiquinone/menaquinone biosynthesis C-methylase UbiE
MWQAPNIKQLDNHMTKKVENWYSMHNNFLGGDNYYNYMNHGYYPPYKKLFDYHKIFKHQASLYLHLFDDIDTKNKSILEVGCGRGGGINLLNKMFDFKNIEACDLSEENINHCQKYANGIKFEVANAENLDYEHNQFDVVINVESSHGYNYLDPFFSKVQKILKSGGVFLYTDNFYPIDTTYVEQQLSLCFKNVKKEDITNNIIQSCEHDIEHFDKVLPNDDRKKWITNSQCIMQNRYKSGEIVYIKYVCSQGRYS